MDKAITLSDGTDDYVESGKTIIARGTPQHTFSLWVKPSNEDHDDTGTHYMMVWGSETAQNKWSGIALSNDGRLAHAYHASAKRTVDQILPTPGAWYHVVVVVKSISATTAANRDVEFYIDGELYTGNYATFGSQNTGTSYYLDWGSGTHTSVRLGSLHAASEDSSSSLSTIKLYDVALTASEVKTLYDMGRTGSVANPQPLHISGPVNVMGDIRYITSRPLALPTMWDHMANGNCAKGVYPIVGTQGGSKVYNVYCEPDLAGGGWMCMAQISRNGYQVRSHPTDGDLDLFTKSIGDSKNIRWDNTFAVPINILSNNSGYDLDVMVYVSGGSLASRYEGGMRLGAVWRGANLAQAFNPGRVSGIVDRSGLATSGDGYGFTSRTPVTGGNYGIQTSGSWYYAIAGSSGQGAYDDYGYSDGGWILHQGATSNHVGKLYGGLHRDDGTAENMYGSTNWVCARIFVRPSIY